MAGLGKKRRVLMVGGEGVVLYASSGKVVERETSIAWEVPGFGVQLAEALRAKNAAMAVLVLFDGADQAYRKEDNIPKLSPFDRPKFVKRKLELAFPSYPIRASLEVKPPKGVKAPSSYLFAALPETEQFDRVGDALFESGVPVAGFGLLPVESAGLVTSLAQKLFVPDKKDKGSRWRVLIGQHETGGLRQVVVKDGNLALSRLTPTSEAGVAGPGWVEEVQKGFRETLAYVSRFGYTAQDGIDVVVICGEIEKQFFDPKAMPVSNFRCLNVAEALKTVGLKGPGLEKSNFGDALHAAWAAQERALKLPVRVPSIHRIMAPRMGARVASVALALTALGLTALTAQDYGDFMSTRDELVAKKNQQQMMQREYDVESRSFDALPLKPDVVRGTLAVKKTLDDASPNPVPLLSKLRAALGPDITLKSLVYEHVHDNDDKGIKPGKGRVRFAFDFGLPLSMPLEQKVTRAEELQKTLQKAFDGWDVKIESQFGKVSRTGSFEGAAGGLDVHTPDANDAAAFTMEGPAP
jgi:hypothetical protein